VVTASTTLTPHQAAGAGLWTESGRAPLMFIETAAALPGLLAASSATAGHTLARPDAPRLAPSYRGGSSGGPWKVRACPAPSGPEPSASD
jgi:hypothetical protein